MRIVALSVIALFLVQLCFATNDRRVFLPEHHRPNSDGFQRIGQSPPKADVSFLIMLKPHAEKEVESYLLRVSDPESPHYGRYLSLEELSEMTTNNAQMSRVSEWLRRTGLDEHCVYTGTNDMLSCVQVPVHMAEKVFATEFSEYRSKDNKRTVHKCEVYTLPMDVGQEIEFVSGISVFTKTEASKLKIEAYNQRGIDMRTNPISIQTRYKIPALTHSSNNLQAVASFLEQYVNLDDLVQFWDTMKMPDYKVDKLIGPNDETKPGAEASLDIQYLMGVANGLKTWIWSTGGLHEGQEPFIKWLYDVSNTTTVPNLFSISYQDLEDTISLSFMKRVSYEFMKAGNRGITLVTGSGDWGTQCNDECTRFRPDFPSSSPYIVSTGATAFVWNEEKVVDEIGVKWSSGGFSEVFDRPSYQDDVIEEFLKKTKTPTSYFNTKGRAFPDVGAVGVNFPIVVGGVLRLVNGTSAATPTFAAVLSVINDARLSKGLPALGFVNPALYKAYARSASSFYDVVEGNNQYGCCKYGFDCLEGWDPITGMGTPNYEILAPLMM